MKPGDVAEIFEDPLTCKKLEGRAVLIALVQDGRESQLWKVQFVGESEWHLRWIKTAAPRAGAPLSENRRILETLRNMTMSSTGDAHATLDCGCEMGREDGMFIIKPCSPHCPIYLYVIAETHRRGNKLWFVSVKDDL